MQALRLSFDRTREARTLRGLGRNLPLTEHPVAAVRADVLAAARRSWEDRARQEYVGVLLMRYVHGLLVDVNAPMDIQEAALTMLVDEQRHTALAIDAARALGASGELSFDVDELQVRRTGEPEAELLDLLMGMFLVSEVVALDLLLHAIEVLPATSYRDVLRRIAKDEVFHARFGALLLRSLRGREPWLQLPTPEALRACVDEHVSRMQARDVVNDRERVLFEDPVAAAQLESLGVPDPSAFAAAYRCSLQTSVPAGLAAAGLTFEGSSSR